MTTRRSRAINGDDLGWPFVTPAWTPTVTEVVTDDGAVLHVRSYGPSHAPLVVLPHGWSCSIEYWYPQINTLAENHSVIAFDQRGHGRSTRGRRVFSTAALAADLESVLAATVPTDRRAVLAGHSMGGISIMAWAAAFPGSVTRRAHAVLLASTSGDLATQDIRTPARADAPYPRIRAAALELLTKVPVPAPSRFLSRGVFRSIAGSEHASPEAVEFAQRVASACNPWTRRDAARVLRRSHVITGLRGLRVPTTVTGGELDALIPLADSQRIADELLRFGNLREYIVVPQVGHMSTLEAPDLFNRLIAGMTDAADRQAAQ